MFKLITKTGSIFDLHDRKVKSKQEPLLFTYVLS